MTVSIDLSKPGMIVIRHLPDVESVIESRRQELLHEDEDFATASRRVAMTYHFFREGSLVVPERRIGLKAIVHDHLDTKPGARLFCVAYPDRIEAYNEPTARDLIGRHADDLRIGLQG